MSGILDTSSLCHPKTAHLKHRIHQWQPSLDFPQQLLAGNAAACEGQQGCRWGMWAVRCAVLGWQLPLQALRLCACR